MKTPDIIEIFCNMVSRLLIEHRRTTPICYEFRSFRIVYDLQQMKIVLILNSHNVSLSLPQEPQELL